MSYIPALHRKTGYIVHLPPGGTGPQPSTLDRARQTFLAELTALAATSPSDAEAEAEGMASAARQLVHLASATQPRIAR